MKEFASDKLLLLPLLSAGRDAYVRDVETLFVYSLMGRLALYTDVRCQDLATKDDHVLLDAATSYDEMTAALTQIARECGARFLLSGSITILVDDEDASPPGRLESCRVTLRLFDAQENRLTGETPWTCGSFESAADTAETGACPWPRPRFDLFCELVNAGFDLVQEALFQTEAASVGLCAPPLAASYEALRALITADRLKGTPEEKIAAYHIAIALDPTLEAAHFNLGNLFKTIGDYRQSVAHYRRALELSRGRNRIRALYATEAGVCCALLGEPDPALQWWARAIEIAPDYLSPYLNIAHYHEEAGDLTQAETYALQAQGAAPYDARPCYSLARMYSKRGDWTRAIEQYERQMLRDGEDAWRHNDIATCRLQLGQLDAARGHLQRAAALDPHGEAGAIASLILAETTPLGALDDA